MKQRNTGNYIIFYKKNQKSNITHTFLALTCHNLSIHVSTRILPIRRD